MARQKAMTMNVSVSTPIDPESLRSPKALSGD
jgi:hypothetical protein